jgi:hypothetical protein
LWSAQSVPEDLTKIKDILAQLWPPTPTELGLVKHANKLPKFTIPTDPSRPKHSILTGLPKPLTKPPFLIITPGGQPMIRYKKPQPLVLGHVIKAMIRRSDRDVIKLIELDEIYSEAEVEDRWDELVRVMQAGSGSKPQTKSSKVSMNASVTVLPSFMGDQKQSTTSSTKLERRALESTGQKHSPNASVEQTCPKYGAPHSHLSSEEPEPSWVTHISEAKRHMNETHKRRRRRDEELGLQMANIVQRERNRLAEIARDTQDVK